MWYVLISKPRWVSYNVIENNAIAFSSTAKSPQEVLKRSVQARRIFLINFEWRQLVAIRIVNSSISSFISLYLSFVRALIIHGCFAPHPLTLTLSDRFMPSTTLEYWFHFFILFETFCTIFHHLNFMKNLFFHYSIEIFLSFYWNWIWKWRKFQMDFFEVNSKMQP